VSISVPAINIRPPAVTIGPPRLGAPNGTIDLRVRAIPSALASRIVPAFMSTAAKVPHGGGTHGQPVRLRKNEIPIHSVRRAVLLCIIAASDIRLGFRVKLVPRNHSHIRRQIVRIDDEQLAGRIVCRSAPVIPPRFLGIVSVPLMLGGVKIPSLRRPA